MGMTGAKLEAERKQCAARLARGEEFNSFTLTNMTRVMKVSKYFRDATNRWKMGVLLMLEMLTESVMEHVRIQSRGTDDSC